MILRHRHALPLTRPAVSSRGGLEKAAEIELTKNLDFPFDSYTPFDLEELDESESFAKFRFGKRDIRNLKEVLQIPDNIN